MKSLGPILASPLICLAMLGGIALENRTHARPDDAASYHLAAKAEIEAWPQTIRSGDDEWTSREWKMPEAAVQLLRPNAAVCRRYVSARNEVQMVDLLIVQCHEPSDMSGHYPPNCYPAGGETLSQQQPRAWQVGDTTIHGMEYHFEPKTLGDPRKCVYNFFVLPGRGIVADMTDVRRASGDYQRRYYGAAQFQLVFDRDVPQPARDEVFRTIIGADPGIFATLNPAGL